MFSDEENRYKKNILGIKMSAYRKITNLKYCGWVLREIEFIEYFIKFR